MKDTLLQLCIFFTIGIIIFSLVFGLIAGITVSGRHLFSEEEQKEGTNVDTSTKEDAFEDISGEDLTNSLLLSVGAGGFLGILVGTGLSFLTKTTSGIGVGLFSGVFWGSYINMNSIINAGGLLSDYGILIIIHVVVAMLFVGAVIGMFTGGG